MQKLSMRKMSMLGLVLLAASAVTAAIVPNKSDKNAVKFDDGSLTAISEDPNGTAAASSNTCEVTAGDINNACNISASGTTAGAGASSDNPANNSGGNNTTAGS